MSPRLRRVGERVLEVDELVVEVAEAAAARDRLVEDGPARHLVDLLPEVADREPSSARTRRRRPRAPRP